MIRFWNSLALVALVACNGTEIPEYGLFVEPEIIDLATATINADGTATLWVTVANTGDGQIDVNEIILSEGAPEGMSITVGEEGPGAIAEGEILQVGIIFDPEETEGWGSLDEFFLVVDAAGQEVSVGCGSPIRPELDLYVPILVSPMTEGCDLDEDGFISNMCGGLDCDDANSAVNPGALEVCNGIDDDCNDIVDIDSVEALTFYEDYDEDGYGDPAVSVIACEAPDHYVNNGLDCKDTNAQINPDALEVCDDQDNDCDGVIDGADAIDRTAYYADMDGDSYGEGSTEILACDPPVIGGMELVSDGSDCDDNNYDVNPAAIEACDGIDNDCDGEVDELGSLGEITYYPDVDGDLYGDPSMTVTSCVQFTGYVSDGTDCDDSIATTYPGATELCDGEDNDCDGEVDNNAVDLMDWYVDGDGDGYGTGIALTTCDQPSGYVAMEGDCDDGNVDASPAGVEVCDEVDNDCDGSVDNVPTDGITYYLDDDGDTYGLDNSMVNVCSLPAGYAEVAGDCDDAADMTYPGADEICDGADNDCDGLSDEDAVDQLTWYADGDLDSFGDADDGITACEQPAGRVADASDCNDGDVAINPDATEICDGVDNNCSGFADDGAPGSDPWYIDADGDGYGDDDTLAFYCTQPQDRIQRGEDCDDADVAINPLATEVCDGVDNNCSGVIDDSGTQGGTFYADADNDSFGAADEPVIACSAPVGFVVDDTDCDDADATAFPGAVEVCDGDDENCDGEIDELGATGSLTFYEDADRDGFGDAASVGNFCSAPADYVEDDTDCDDSNAFVYPGAQELCDSFDNDCNGIVDDNTNTDATWFVDTDGDGFGSSSSTLTQCTQPVGYVLDSSDCNDGNAIVYPFADEYCDGLDNDCDGSIDESALDTFTWYADTDGDLFGDMDNTMESCAQPADYVSDSADCDDSMASVNPNAAEICDGLDQNCDGAVDNDAVDATLWYLDADGDLYGDPLTAEPACTAPAGHVADDTDCNDSDAGDYPGALEYCDGVDNDCDFTVDEDPADGNTYYLDGDSDGYGVVGSTANSCSLPAGYADQSGDCDDSLAGVNPGADEVCNGIDDDCSGASDDDPTDGIDWYADSDGDTYGDPGVVANECSPPAGYLADNTDCDDTSVDIYPGAPELCDGADNNCNGAIDETPPTWFVDSDSDGYGSGATTLSDCTQPAGYVGNDDDCDDSTAVTYPGASEICDDADNDCDGAIDEDATDPTTWYRDFDGDSFGTVSDSVDECDQPAGYVALSTDCNDSAASVFPGADETCNSIDDDCDGATDENPVDGTTWYADSDQDGFGDLGSSVSECALPSGYAASSSDCDDLRDDVYPGAPELCDGVDNDCDLTIDESPPTWYIDSDGDGYGDAGGQTQDSCAQPNGYVLDATDCDDDDNLAYPGADELCDGTDNDCDLTVDENDAIDATTWYIDGDDDGYGNLVGGGITQCDLIAGRVGNNQDCDDTEPAINPVADEECDGVDNDCDNLIDDQDSNVSGQDFWYADTDGDGFGDMDTSVEACSVPAGYTSSSDDCDDTSASSYPGAAETCDGEDNDCNGQIDDNVANATTWYADFDGDGYGNANNGTTQACSQPPFYSATNDDCNDSTFSINPGASEICDGQDNDCDGEVDGPPVTWYRDNDNDGYGGSGSTITAPEDCPPAWNYVLNSDDCDDTTSNTYPGANEFCDFLDNDCDGDVDEDALDADTFYYDGDSDGWGDSSNSVVECWNAIGNDWAWDDGDCDDTEYFVNPGAWEECDAQDNDCDGVIDEGQGCPCPVEMDDNGKPFMVCSTAQWSSWGGWDFAQEDCEDHGYTLAVINDQDENDFLQDLASLYGGGDYWIGYTDQGSEGNWYWYDGSSASYTNWMPNEPNNAGWWGEDCAAMRGSDGLWNDLSCWEDAGMICEGPDQ